MGYRRDQLLLASVMVFEFAAAPALAQSNEPWDPWEPFNRRMYAVNRVLDRHVLAPLAHGFGKLPAVIRVPITNFAVNLGEPVVFVNDVLQGRIPTAARTVARFTMNTTVGIAGFRDVAAHNHLPHHDNGFGATLGRWGAQPGPYLFLPLVGPSDFRDTIGFAGGVFLNPFYYSQFDGKTALGVSTGVVGGLNARLQADQALTNIDQTSTDPYATLRSYYLQNRDAAIRGTAGQPQELPEFELPDIPSEEAPAGSAAPPGAPPVSQPPSATGIPPLGGGAGALPHPKAAPPAGEPNPPSPAPPPSGQPPRDGGQQ